MNTSKTLQKPYTQVINSLLNDPELSLKAKGLYAFMDSKPSGWNFTYRSMAKQLLEGKESVRTGLKELRDKGYINYTKKINGYGEYTLNDGIAPKPENPSFENRIVRKSDRISNKELLVKKIVTILNEKASKRYRVTDKTRGLVVARLNEGFTLEDFEKVIKVKCNEWIEDESMSKYLRPETLFGTKFEGYLNQEDKKVSGGFNYARHNK